MASEVSEGRTLVCIALVRKVNSLKKDMLLFITSIRAFTEKCHIERACEIKLLILVSPSPVSSCWENRIKNRDVHVSA